MHRSPAGRPPSSRGSAGSPARSNTSSAASSTPAATTPSWPSSTARRWSAWSRWSASGGSTPGHRTRRRWPPTWSTSPTTVSRTSIPIRAWSTARRPRPSPGADAADQPGSGNRTRDGAHRTEDALTGEHRREPDGVLLVLRQRAPRGPGAADDRGGGPGVDGGAQGPSEPRTQRESGRLEVVGEGGREGGRRPAPQGGDHRLGRGEAAVVGHSSGGAQAVQLVVDRGGGEPLPRDPQDPVPGAAGEHGRELLPAAGAQRHPT